jgi:DNA-binding XRE family transcriptional regulator
MKTLARKMRELPAIRRHRIAARARRIVDARDRAVIARQRALEARIGKEVARADYLDDALVNRLLDGESPVRIWREHRGLTLKRLSEEAGVPQGHLSEIETGKKPGSLDAMARIARALAVPLDDLAPAPQRRRRKPARKRR